MWKGYEYACQTCGIKFNSKHKNIRFCSNQCRGSSINNFNKDGIPWNKKENKIRECLVCGKALHSQTRSGLCIEHCQTKEHKENISNSLKGKSGGIRKGSGVGKKGWYKGIWCDSSWELAWIIYNLEHNIVFERNKDKFKYIYENTQHYYTPDFKLDNYYIEIKGYMTDMVQAKIDQFPYKLIIIKKEEIQPFINYVINKYGKDFIKLYETSDSSVG